MKIYYNQYNIPNNTITTISKLVVKSVLIDEKVNINKSTFLDKIYDFFNGYNKLKCFFNSCRYIMYDRFTFKNHTCCGKLNKK